ncbi:hepatitis A virus cellular receptor, partial [Pristimantis euphronides]
MKLCTNCRDSLQVAILLLLSSVSVLCQKTVIGIEGQPVTLPCSYSVKQPSDITSMCWGIGSCPNSKCTQELIWTDGYRVTHQSSPRYQLKDKISEGIVSMTIDQANLQDAGTYCCRIEHRGWFNDEKINIILRVERAPTTTVRSTVTTTTPAPTTVKTTRVPPTLKTSTTPPMVHTTLKPFHVWTNPLTTSVEITTQPTMSATNNTSQLPPVVWTESPPSSTARATSPSPDLIPTDTTEHTDLTPQSSDLPGFVPDHELTTSTESKTGDGEHTTHSVWHQSSSPDDDYDERIANLFQGNDTASMREHRSTIIIAITLTAIVLVVICVIILQLKGRKSGSHLFGMDPNLELVTHAEEPMTEPQAGAKNPNSAEEDKVET